MADEVRLDKWLWAARFFKTRALARKAIEGGKVRVEGARAKPGKTVQIGQRMDIRRGQDTFQISVTGLSGTRGPASVARELYEETEEGRKAREQDAEERKTAARAEPDYGGRPDKYQRRRIRKLMKNNRRSL